MRIYMYCNGPIVIRNKRSIRLQLHAFNFSAVIILEHKLLPTYVILSCDQYENFHLIIFPLV